MEFFQEAPQLSSAFPGDRTMHAWLRRVLPEPVLVDIAPSLASMGERGAGALLELSRAHRGDEPRYVPFDPWGHRIDRVEVNAAWREFARIAARDGIVGTAYERRHGAFSRVHQFALAFLFAPSSQSYSCPLAMTDGCARTLELVAPQAIRDLALPRLVSRDPETAWTSGQWMTERTGGSDVGLTETVARPGDDGTYRLHGTKWFTSAVTSDIALTLARPEGNGPGGKGLALFFVKLRDADGRLNHIVVHRLKEKLGTRYLPTAELTLEGTIATPIAGLSDGIRHMGSMLNLTRTWNAVCAVAGMQRGLALARDYARRRVAFGAPLSDKPLHLETLADLQAEYEAAFCLTFFEVLLLGKSESGESTPAENAVLAVLHPLTKLLTAKMAVASASEVLECFGGAGYVEDTGLPELLRDSQVLPIWEGTTNVLALETLRTLVREDAWEPVLELVRRCGRAASDPRLAELGLLAIHAAERAMAWARSTAGESRPALEAGARQFAFTLGRAVALALLVEHAEWSLTVDHDRRATEAARRFAEHGIDVLASSFDGATARALALDDAFG